MKAVIQRVSQASVTIDSKKVSEISKGLLVLVGIEDADSQEDITWLSSKIVNLRIFSDENDCKIIYLKILQLYSCKVLVVQALLNVRRWG